jgi:hypothetical protein
MLGKCTAPMRNLFPRKWRREPIGMTAWMVNAFVPNCITILTNGILTETIRCTPADDKNPKSRPNVVRLHRFANSLTANRAGIYPSTDPTQNDVAHRCHVAHQCATSGKQATAVGHFECSSEPCIQWHYPNMCKKTFKNTSKYIPLFPASFISIRLHLSTSNRTTYWRKYGTAFGGNEKQKT